MYIDLIVIVLLILFVIFYFRKFSNLVYFVGILDIFLRLMYFLRQNIPLPELKRILSNLPSSLLSLIDKYTNGILYSILAWAWFVILLIFLGYVFKTFIKRKKWANV